MKWLEVRRIKYYPLFISTTTYDVLTCSWWITRTRRLNFYYHKRQQVRFSPSQLLLADLIWQRTTIPHKGNGPQSEVPTSHYDRASSSSACACLCFLLFYGCPLSYIFWGSTEMWFCCQIKPPTATLERNKFKYRTATADTTTARDKNTKWKAHYFSSSSLISPPDPPRRPGEWSNKWMGIKE